VALIAEKEEAIAKIKNTREGFIEKRWNFA